MARVNMIIGLIWLKLVTHPRIWHRFTRPVVWSIFRGRRAEGAHVLFMLTLGAVQFPGGGCLLWLVTIILPIGLIIYGMIVGVALARSWLGL